MKYIELKNVNFYRIQYAFQAVLPTALRGKIPLRHLLKVEDRELYKDDLDKLILSVEPHYPKIKFEFAFDAYAETLILGIED